MNINVDEIVKQEIRNQVKQKVGNHFQNEIKKELTRSTVKNEVAQYIKKHIVETIDVDEVIAELDLTKIHNDIVSRVSYAIASKLDCEEYL